MSIKAVSLGLALSLAVTLPPTVQAQDRQTQREYRNEKRKNSLLGAGLGLLGGAILSGGDPWATIGGAAAGGLVGNVATKDKRRDYWRDRRDDRRDRWRGDRDDRRDRRR